MSRIVFATIVLVAAGACVTGRLPWHDSRRIEHGGGFRPVVDAVDELVDRRQGRADIDAHRACFGWPDTDASLCLHDRGEELVVRSTVTDARGYERVREIRRRVSSLSTETTGGMEGTGGKR